MHESEDFPGLLLRLRKERGWTQKQVAERCGNVAADFQKSAADISRYERGIRIPTPATRQVLAEVFEVAADEIDRAAAVSRRHLNSARISASADADAPRQVGAPSHAAPTLREEVIPVDRRTFAGGTVVAVATTAARPRPVNPELIGYFNEQLDGHYKADTMLGPHDLIGTVTAQFDLIERLADQAKGSIRLDLCRVATSYASFAAWLHQDAGELGTAMMWHGTAHEMAHRSQNADAIAFSLVDRAIARTDQGAGRAVVDLCESALSQQRGLSPKARIFALQQHAHGAALVGDRSSVDRSLDLAAQLLGQIVDDGQPRGTACIRTPNYLEVQRATCYGRLGLAREADRLWQQLIPNVPTTARRDVGVWTARHAIASASANNPDQAVELARPAVAMALETGSERARRELLALKTAMRPWQGTRVGQDLQEVLAPFRQDPSAGP